MNHCAQDIIFWIEVFCWTKDPRRSPDILPFICFDAFQEEYLLKVQEHITHGKDLLTEKSRDMGASWMILYAMQHQWLFINGSDFKLGSRKEEYVDRPGDIDTLFEKLRFNLSKMPAFLMPKDFNWSVHSTYMKLLNPMNGNSMVGESMNVNFGSGGRRKAVLMDEFSKVERGTDKGAWTSTADVSPCRLPISTPFGSANKFAQLAQGTGEKIEKATLHWTLHPSKAKGAYYLNRSEKISIDLTHNSRAAFDLWNKKVKVRSPWYDLEGERRSQQDVAQELDINYLTSGNPFFDLEAVAAQKSWTQIQPKEMGLEIPYGNYVVANLIDVDNKISCIETPNGWLRIYERPSEYLEYVLAEDSSEGLAKGDEAYGVVREKRTRNVVASFNGRWKPEDFAQKGRLVEKYYAMGSPSRVIVAPENNNMGYATCSEHEALGSNLYWCNKEVFKDGMKISERHKPGFNTTSVTRPLMLAQGEEEVRKKVCEIRDAVILQQMMTFVNNSNTGKPEADGDFHDDGVLAWLIGGLVIQQHPVKATTESRLNRESIQRERVLSSKNGGFGYR